MSSLETLACIARQHGHDVKVEVDRVLVAVEWVNGTTGEFSIDWETARNKKELLEILGY